MAKERILPSQALKGIVIQGQVLKEFFPMYCLSQIRRNFYQQHYIAFLSGHVTNVPS